jgi:tRNA nucleotidyltransferase (CCA-adding enzyme)
VNTAESTSERERALCTSISAAVPEEAFTISRVLAGAGHHAWLVGGSVRDLIRLWHGHAHGTLPSDFDLCTDAKPDVVRQLFRRVIPTGIAHGTVTVVLGRRHFEVTTLRGERGYSDGRRPDEVFFVEDLRQDLARRDFTVNAIAFDLEHPAVIDPFNGRGDLERGVLRAVGDPLQRFSEDGLRVLRCARFTSTLGLEVEEATRAAMRPSLASFAKVAGERVREEWLKALASPAPSRAFGLLRSEGLLAVTCAELFPEGDGAMDRAYGEACERLDHAPTDPILRLSLLLVFAAEPARSVGLLAQKLKLSGAEKARLLRLSEPAAKLVHAPPDLPDAKAVRRLLRELGAEYVRDIVRIAELAEGGAHLREVGGRLLDELSRNPPLSLRDLQVSGGDLIAEGMPPGPEVGRMLERLLEATLDDPAVNQKEQLLSLARQLK